MSVDGGDVSNLDISNKNLVAGSDGKVVLVKQDGSTTDIVLSELNSRVEELKTSFSAKEKYFQGSGVEAEYVTGFQDSNGDRTWRQFDLDIANEGTTKKFQTDENVWDALLTGYDSSTVTLPDEVSSSDTVIQALQILEAQLDQASVTIDVTTPMIDNGSVDPETHFAPPTDSGFFLLSGS